MKKWVLLLFINCIVLFFACANGGNNESKFVQVEKIKKDSNLYDVLNGIPYHDLDPLDNKILQLEDEELLRYYDIPVKALEVSSINGDSIDMIHLRFLNDGNHLKQIINTLNSEFGNSGQTTSPIEDESTETLYYWDSTGQRIELSIVRSKNHTILRANLYIFFNAELIKMLVQ